MKLHLQTSGGLNSITGYGADHVLINGRRQAGNVAVLPDEVVEHWAGAGYAGLCAADFERLLPLRPEIVLLGTGSQQRFPPPAVLRPLITAAIGYEIMDLGAACRTYNILMAEGRRVVAALVFD